MSTYGPCFIKTGAVLMFLFVSTALSRAACLVQRLATPAPKDPVARVLGQQSTCPKNAQELGELLKRLGARLEPTMVNFVGFHNPAPGAFFVFEIASAAGSDLTIERGDLLFGHFLTAAKGRLISQGDGLLIELIAWDTDKQFYNFYENIDGTW